jgi:hypothetical protein
LEKNINDVFSNLEATNRLVYAKLKNTINNQENKLIGTIDDLKQRINIYFNEQILMNTQINTKNNYPVTKINLRKGTNIINVEK